MSETFPLISIITVNYNQAEITCEMLRSLYRSGYPNMEVWVVDNASPADRPDIISERFPQVHFIQSAQNLGFAGGNNLALRQARGEYIYLLNNDTIVPHGHLHTLVGLLHNHATCHVVSPKIKLFDDPNILLFAGFTELSPITFRNRILGFGQRDCGQHDAFRESACAHGAAMMLTRAVIEKVGLMNEEYFLYYEEVDWSARIKKAGYKIGYTPDTFVLHRESLSTGRSSALKSYYLNRNRVLYIVNHTSGATRVLAVMYQMCVAMPKNIITHLVCGQTANAKAVAKAWCRCVWKIVGHDRCACVE
jgi:GT2 family glycosyltransferase